MKASLSVPGRADRVGPSPASWAPTDASALAMPWVERMAADWREGRKTTTEAILRLDPALGDRADVAVRLIYEEVCLREEYGTPVSTEEVLGRFPRWRVELGVLLGCHRALDSCVGEPGFPSVGEELGGFSLTAELGRAPSAASSSRPSRPSRIDRSSSR